MARYSLTDFFSARHACSRRNINKAVIAAVTGQDRRAVLAMFRKWHPSTNFSNVAFKRLALSKPAPLTRGRINPSVTELRKKLEDLAYDRWVPPAYGPAGSRPGGKITIPPMPSPGYDGDGR